MFDMMTVQVPSDLEEITPGHDLGSVLASLDCDRLSPHDMVRVLQAQQRQVSHYQAASYWTMDRIVDVFEDPESDQTRELEQAVEGAAAEIGAALRLTRRSADIETGLAVDLSRRLPAVLNALLLGRIDMRRARVLVDATLHVHVSTARKVIDGVIEDAATLTTGQLRHRVNKLCIDINPDAAEGRYEWALDERRLVLEANDSGTANLLGLDVPPHIAKAINRHIHREAIKLRNLGDTRTMDQLRADIYLDILRQRSSRARKGKATADRGAVILNVDPATLAGLNEHSGELNGYGPVIADIARQVAEHQQDSEWRWSLIDPDTGRPIDGGITRRRPTVSQRRRAETLYPTCVHPGCRMPAIDCDIDHRIPYSERQVTCTGDLSPLCRHHHSIRHKFGWTFEDIEGGDYLFTTPLEHHYTTSGRSP